MDVSKAEARALIERYFKSFNQGDFEQTANLFAQTGQLMPPFEGQVIGPENIVSYLKKKAENMEARPKEWTLLHLDESGQWQVDVSGHVKAIVFQVNVNWQFTVTQNSETQNSEISAAQVKLVASPKELLSLRSAKGKTEETTAEGMAVKETIAEKEAAIAQ